MRKSKVVFMVTSLLLACAMMLNLTGCAMRVSAENLMDGITPNEVTGLQNLDDQNAAV